MIAAASFLCLAAGVGLAVLARRRPERTALERWSGACLVAGLGLLGAALHGGR